MFLTHFVTCCIQVFLQNLTLVVAMIRVGGVGVGGGTGLNGNMILIHQICQSRSEFEFRFEYI